MVNQTLQIMKTRFLFPHKFRKVGLVLFLLGIGLYALFYSFGDQIMEYEIIQGNMGNVIPINIISHDVNLILFIAGLLLIGFTKEKIEDEQIAQLRLDSLQWAMYFNYALMLICVLVVNGMDFLAVMAYQIFTPLAFFIIRFRWTVYQSTRLLRSEEQPV